MSVNAAAITVSGEPATSIPVEATTVEPATAMKAAATVARRGHSAGRRKPDGQRRDASR
jgi:hypothetical protein